MITFFRTSELEEQLKRWFPSAVFVKGDQSNGRKLSVLLDAFKIEIRKLGSLRLQH